MSGKKFAFTAIILLFTGSYNFSHAGQSEITEDFKPASSNQPGKQYPQVNSERRARFRLVQAACKGRLALLRNRRLERRGINHLRHASR